jgi:tRNA threonylcarbamoyl adenosine modification protein YeaZ
MYVLAIDTSSAAVTAAVAEVADDLRAVDGIDVRAVAITVDARAHAEVLIPSIQAALTDAGVTVADVGAVVAGVGPGPFTGLRVGLVTAAVLGDILDVSTYGVCSLDAIAAGLTDEPLLVAGDARRHEVYWGRYVGGARSTGPDVDRPTVVDTAGLAAMTGAGARRYASVFGLALLDRDYPTPGGLVALAADRIRRGARSERLTPLYLRRPDAVVPAALKAVTP